MKITGEALIGGIGVKGAGASFLAYDPTNQVSLQPEIHAVDEQQIANACLLAHAAFDPYRATSNTQRADFLETIAKQITALGDTLIERATAESGLPKARIEGERTRTINQLGLFANLLREGSWRDIRIDSALPERQPPRLSLRMQLIGVGPVAIFGASNFPLAFSVAGGDTASALAAGCPVVVKAHPAHPGTSELVGRAIQEAVRICGLPQGVFALLTGNGNEVGEALVKHPAIQAVGFTGSRRGGMALMALAAARRQPIPVFAEMSSVNPVFLLPKALSTRGKEIAKDFAASLTLGVGQFCTNPGLILALEGTDFDDFCNAAAMALKESQAATMLTPGIAENYQRAIQEMGKRHDVTPQIQKTQEAGKGSAELFITSGENFLAQPELADEVFGPSAMLIACKDVEQLCAIAESLEGQLTASLQMDDADLEIARRLLPILERKAGRILANSFPTGVEVASAMVHGGPFPATSDGRSTSVGTAAIYRFLRPVSYQNLLQELLPTALQDENTRAVWHRRDGVLTYTE